MSRDSPKIQDSDSARSLGFASGSCDYTITTSSPRISDRARDNSEGMALCITNYEQGRSWREMHRPPHSSRPETRLWPLSESLRNAPHLMNLICIFHPRCEHDS